MTQKTQHQPIGTVEIGDSFSGIYYVENVFVRKAKNNKDYQEYTLRDKSGSRFVKYWGVIDDIKKGDFVFIAANVEDYMGNPSIIAKNIQKENPPTDMSLYIPAFEDLSKYAESFDSIREVLKKTEEEFGDDTLGKIIDEVYGNGVFFQKFIKAPGSARPHYGREGGLLANTVRVTELCVKLSDSYDFTKQEKSILIAAALICRIGAIDAFEFKDCMPVETKKGVLLGINNLTMTRVSSALKRVSSEIGKSGKTINQESLYRFLHAVSSYNSMDMKPMTKEALLLASVIRTDTELVESIEFIQNDVNLSEEFTAYDSSMRRRYYTGNKSN